MGRAVLWFFDDLQDLARRNLFFTKQQPDDRHGFLVKLSKFKVVAKPVIEQFDLVPAYKILFDQPENQYDNKHHQKKDTSPFQPVGLVFIKICLFNGVR